MTDTSLPHVPSLVTVAYASDPDGTTLDAEHAATQVDIEHGNLILTDGNKTAAIYAHGHWRSVATKPHPDRERAEALAATLVEQARAEARDEVRRAVLDLAPGDKEFAEDVSVIFIEKGWSEA